MKIKPTPDESISLRSLQTIVDEWITTTGVRYFSPLTNMAILAEETGEVARIMARRFGDQSFKPGENADALADELADVLWVLTAIANQTGIDLTEAFRRNIEKKASATPPDTPPTRSCAMTDRDTAVTSQNEST